MLKRELIHYWPREEDVAACVKTDAEASSEAVSLAVHQPMRFERRLVGGEGGALEPCDEHELLRTFLADKLSEGRVILPIVGSSGIGKSHVVRWLYSQLLRIPGADRRVVIRIPKGTSLKGVLSILLDEVQGEPYEKYRQELVRAQQELDPRQAAGLLCEMLAQTLEEMAAEADARLRTNPSDKSAQEHEAFCRRDMLPNLLRNQTLRDQHFLRNADGEDGVVRRLVEQLTEGRAAGAEDDRQHAFRPEDLQFDDRIERATLGRGVTRAIDALERGERRETATRILNIALDAAKQRLLRLEPTVSDLFDAVRKELLRDGKELVLLVEDFAVLSGIQKQLLQVIIKEAVRDGRQVLCTMRTALAYTTGYMDTATVLTRANIEYRIPDEPGTEEHILARIDRLVGAYLNAARLGQALLEKAYDGVSEMSESPQDWVPVFQARVEPDTRATLSAFGATDDGYELFPFNVDAIHELAREGCVQDGRVVYNPRFVIQNVINKVLVHRELYERGLFPQPTFGTSGRRLPARASEEVRRRVPPTDLDRYLRFLVYWGGYPNALDEISRVESRVFVAFGLDKTPFGRGSAPPAASPKVRETATQQTSTQEVASRSFPKDPREERWEETLEEWRTSVPIPQAEANQLRKWLADALRDYLDFDWDLFRLVARDSVNWGRWFSEAIYIPNASGHGGRTAEDAMSTVCEQADLADEAKSSRMHATLMAVVRFHEIHRGTWDYEGAEEDLPRYGALLERLASQARPFVRGRYFKAEWDPTVAIVQGLLIGARALGIDGASREDHPALIQAIFAPPLSLSASSEGVAVPTEGDPTEWQAFSDELRRCRATGEKKAHDQASWIDHLLNILGARQGQADTVHAIDVLRLKPAIEESIRTWEFSVSPPTQAGVPEFSAFRGTYVELKKLSAACSKAQRRLWTWRQQALGWLGDSFDKDVLVRELKDTVEVAKAAGFTRAIDTKHLLQLVEAFRTTKVVAALEDIGRLGQEAPRGTVLAILGRDYEAVARLCEELHSSYDAFLANADAELRGEVMTYGEDPLGEAKAAVSASLSKLSGLLKEIEDDGANRTVQRSA